MRDETAEWLAPLMEAAELTADEHTALMRQASMPAAETDNMVIEWMGRVTAGTGAITTGIDWVRFGTLLRSRLGWDDSYPAFPDFPEARDTP